MGLQDQTNVDQFLTNLQLATFRLIFERPFSGTSNVTIDISNLTNNLISLRPRDLASLSINGLARDKTFYPLAFEHYINSFLDSHLVHLNRSQRESVAAALGRFTQGVTTLERKLQNVYEKTIRELFFRDPSLKETYVYLHNLESREQFYLGLNDIIAFVSKDYSFSDSLNYFNKNKETVNRSTAAIVTMFLDSLKRIVTDSVIAPEDKGIETALEKAGCKKSVIDAILFTQSEKSEILAVFAGQGHGISQSTIKKLNRFLSTDEKVFNPQVRKVLDQFPDYRRLQLLVSAANASMAFHSDLERLQALRTNVDGTKQGIASVDSNKDKAMISRR